MFGVICWALICALAVRSFLLIFGSQKPPSVRLLDFLFFLLYAGCVSVLFIFLRERILAEPWVAIIAFTGFMIPIGLLALNRSRKPYVRQPVLFLFKALVATVVLLAAMLAVMMSGFEYLTEDRPVLKVFMTGKQKRETVQWQPPNRTPRNETLTMYEVQFQTPEGEPVAQLFTYGDQVAVKARVLRFRPILNAIGINNLCRVEYVHNSYETAERFNTYPHYAWEIRTAHPWIATYQDRFWKYWESYYRQEDQNAWVKSATVESTYFPLTKPDGAPFVGAYFLTITSGGLSAIPLP